MNRIYRNRRKIVSLSLIMVLVISLFLPGLTAKAEETKYIETSDYVNMRNDASTEAGKITTLMEGTTLILLEELDNGWSKVSYDNQEGYVKSEYLKQVSRTEKDSENMPVEKTKSNMEIITDETAYITLNYDGTLEKVSVVKACDLNQNVQIVDYGSYQSIKNMSTLDEPTISGNQLVWNLKDNQNQRFYYEVVPKDNKIDIPWNISVNYTLNGKPIEGKELAGKSGLVGIDVTVDSNTSCNSYYRNNFMLMAAMMVDTEDNYSFESPGAQFQSLGTYQMAVNAVMPKQNDSFSYYIGSDKFETTGLIIMMVPATMSQFDDIAEMNEHKENIEDASKAVNQTMDDVLSMMASMSTGMNQTADGLDQINSGRQIVANYNDLADASIEEMLQSLSAMETSLNEFSEVMGKTQLASHIASMGDDLNDGLTEMSYMVDHLDDATGAIGNIQNLMSKLENADDSEKQALIDEIRVEINNLNHTLESVNEDGTGDANSIQQTLGDLQDILAELENIGADEQQEIGEEAADNDGETADGMEEAQTQILKSSAVAMANSLSSAGNSVKKSIDNMSDMIDEVSNIADNMERLSEDIGPILKETRIVLEDASSTMKGMSDMIYLMDSMMDEAGDYMNSGTYLTLDGMSQMMRQMVHTLKKTDDIQKNKDVIADVVKDEWNRLDDDLGILDIDTKAVKRSFTSEQNIEPRSLQIVVRTESIELDDDDDANVKIQSSEEDIGVIGRTKQIFVKIGETLTTAFS